MICVLRVAPCDHKAATYAVMNWHYSRSMPMPPLVKFGVWEDGDFKGAVLFGRGASNRLGEPYGLHQTEVCELVRVAMRDHLSPVSQVIGEAMRALRRGSPGMRLIVSFADPNEGHHGGIYQAGNWLYLGQMPSQKYYRDRSGKLHHSRLVKAKGWTTQFGKVTKTLTPANTSLEVLAGKHRYLYPLDKAMRRKLTPLALPYPCGQGVQGDTPAFRAGGPGSTPGDRSIAHAG